MNSLSPAYNQNVKKQSILRPIIKEFTPNSSCEKSRNRYFEKINTRESKEISSRGSRTPPIRHSRPSFDEDLIEEEAKKNSFIIDIRSSNEDEN